MLVLLHLLHLPSHVNQPQQPAIYMNNIIQSTVFSNIQVSIQYLSNCHYQIFPNCEIIIPTNRNDLW